MEYLNSLEPTLRTLWYIAIPASIIFLGQTVLTFFGGDATDGAAADFDGDMGHGDVPFQLFTFRNLINFLLGFSWGGISFYNIIPNTWGLLIFCFAVGVGFMLMFFFIIKQTSRLSEDNTFKMEKAIGLTADVYLRIPAYRAGKGKVQLSVGGSIKELEAITDGPLIETGKVVKVIAIENNILVVTQ